ncbi:MAG: hypothetical protein KBT12_06425 [Bacteroidales bacterium]|nr:hypothetical protein [Candidatus Physcousia equi]
METKIPDGLEKRLLASIDRWEREEKAQKRRTRIGWLAAACMAAVIALFSLPSFFGDADKPLSPNDTRRMAEHKRGTETLTNDSTSELRPILHADMAEQRWLADDATSKKHLKKIGEKTSDTAFFMELKTVEVHPAYELSEVHVQTQPANMATHDRPASCNEVQYINPAKYSTDGVRLGEIEIMQRD